MKKNKIGVIILLVLYMVVSLGFYSYAKVNTKEFHKNEQASRMSEYELIRSMADVLNNTVQYTYGNHDNYTGYYSIEYNGSNNNMNINYMFGTITEDDRLYKVILTDNENYEADLKKHGIKDTKKLDIVSDYNSSLPIFKKDQYKDLIKNINENPVSKGEDLLVIITSNGKVLDNFYIDERLADFSEIKGEVYEDYYLYWIGDYGISYRKDNPMKFKLMPQYLEGAEAEAEDEEENSESQSQEDEEENSESQSQEDEEEN